MIGFYGMRCALQRGRGITFLLEGECYEQSTCERGPGAPWCYDLV